MYFNWRKNFFPLLSLGLLMMVILLSMGRTLWGPSGSPGLWSGDIWSSSNSQRLADPYTITHIEHGIGLYALTHLVARNLPINIRIFAAVSLEVAWEILENTDLVINRYREETLSLDYYGDSVFNSFGDLLAMILGFVLAYRFSIKKTIWFIILLEVFLFIWIKDNLIINLIMLIYPLEFIKNWQLK